MKHIRYSYEKASGKLHADNPNHPGITEADIAEVLTNPALVDHDPDKPSKKYATGISSGKYPFLTVVYIEGAQTLLAITAHPPKKSVLQEYDKRRNEGGEELWIPAEPTT